MMAQDQRWPFIPFVAVRGVQFIFSVIILGLTAYLCSFGDIWWAALGLFIAIIIFLWMVANFVLYFMCLLLPLAVVIVDAFCFLFLLIAMAGTASSNYLSVDCAYWKYTDFYSPCSVVKAAFAFELLGMFLFIASLVFASITLHKTRKDLRGKKYNAGLPFVSGGTAEDQQQYYQQGAPMEQLPPAQPQQQQQQIYPQQQPPQQMQYVQGQTYEGFVSPATSPAPQSIGGYAPPPAALQPPQHAHQPPQGAAEMPVYTQA